MGRSELFIREMLRSAQAPHQTSIGQRSFCTTAALRLFLRERWFTSNQRWPESSFTSMMTLLRTSNNESMPQSVACTGLCQLLLRATNEFGIVNCATMSNWEQSHLWSRYSNPQWLLG